MSNVILTLGATVLLVFSVLAINVFIDTEEGRDNSLEILSKVTKSVRGIGSNT